MQQQKIRIGVFASSISLVDHIEKSAEEGDKQIQIAYEGLDEAISVGQKMQSEGVEVIISRRGTAHLLRENLRIPVLAFPHTSLAVLNSLKEAAQYSKKILLTTFRSKISGIEIAEDLLGIQLVQGVYNDSASLKQVVFMSHQEGCKVTIGGNITARYARECGLQHVEIQTSPDEIAATIENAKSVALANRKEKARVRRYRSIIDAASDGIISVDEKARITTINRTARRLLAIDNDVTGESIDRYIADRSIFKVLQTGSPIYDSLEKINSELLVFNHLPVMLDGEIIGGISTFNDVSQVMKAENEIRRSLSKGLVARYFIEDLVHESAMMRDIVNLTRQFATTDSTILIMGETGTGKEVLAQSTHNLSHRVKQPFVSINCAALPDQLLESELFGYEEGAFTGSKKGGKPGYFEIAHKGTIFLDEIDKTPQNVQIRLLRVLQEREVMRIGADRKIPVDVRVIAAANQDLAKAIQEDRFREDLFFRLNVLRIPIPALRERREDIPLLLDHFIRLNSEKHHLEPIALPDAYLSKLMNYSWPGNVRQLKNFSERLVLNCNLRCSTDTLDLLYSELIQYERKSDETPQITKIISFKEQLTLQKKENEAIIIRRALEKARFCKSRAAKSLGISRTTLWRKMKEAGIE